MYSHYNVAIQLLTDWVFNLLCPCEDRAEMQQNSLTEVKKCYIELEQRDCDQRAAYTNPGLTE